MISCKFEFQIKFMLVTSMPIWIIPSIHLQAYSMIDNRKDREFLRCARAWDTYIIQINSRRRKKHLHEENVSCTFQEVIYQHKTTSNMRRQSVYFSKAITSMDFQQVGGMRFLSKTQEKSFIAIDISTKLLILSNENAQSPALPQKLLKENQLGCQGHG